MFYVFLCARLVIQLYATLWTVACQALLSMEFSRQEYWSRLPFPTLGNLPDPGSNLCLLCFLHLKTGYLPLCHLGSPIELPNWLPKILLFFLSLCFRFTDYLEGRIIIIIDVIFHNFNVSFCYFRSSLFLYICMYVCVCVLYTHTHTYINIHWII